MLMSLFQDFLTPLTVDEAKPSLQTMAFIIVEGRSCFCSFRYGK